ncbi:MAG TPA: NnrS family protein, partial [Burkholderiales bacterium]|nr:NnrS family protein [Burkholderiales bacterium]
MIWKTLSSAPHRLYFLAGAFQGVFAISWWLYDLIASRTGLLPEPDWSVASIWAHAFLMIYGFLPFFIFGFLMTAAPNWVNGKKVGRAHYLPAFLFMTAGIASFYPALLIGRGALAASIVLYLAGWLASALALLHIVVASTSRDKVHAYIVIGNVFIGCMGVLAYLFWLLTDKPGWLHGSVTIGVWLFLLPIFLSVSHRMIPFFSSAVLPDYEPRRPYWPLFALLGGMALHAALELAGRFRYLWFADFPMAVIAFHLSWLWGLRRSFAVRLLAMLHIAFAWLGAALMLYAVQSLVQFASQRTVLGLAPLHALTIGYFSSMALAMVTRVTLGHSGRALKADRASWFLFLGFQSAALFRILGDFPSAGASGFYLAAAMVWLACFTAWD